MLECAVLVMCGLFLSSGTGAQGPPSQGPFFETTIPYCWVGFLELKDGRLMMNAPNGKVAFSTDEGHTWSEWSEMGVYDVIRLRSGRLGGRYKDIFYISEDEGLTWKTQGRIPWACCEARPYHNTMIQMHNGRIILPVRYTTLKGFNGDKPTPGSYGLIANKLVRLETHAHYPEMDLGFVFYSDDEGKTWNKSNGVVLVWLKDGYGGMWPCDEPNIVERKDGSLAMFCRTTLGRLYVATSKPNLATGPLGRQYTIKPGEYFTYPRSTGLSSSYSPCRVRKINDKGHLLCVWNQVSESEIRAGYRRSRLCSAISEDDGKTWKHFRTIARMALPPAGQIMPEGEIGLVRGAGFVGKLPPNYGIVHYPNFTVYKDKVLLVWGQISYQEDGKAESSCRMRIVPLDWFYGEDKAPVSNPSDPKLVLDWPGHRKVKISSFYNEGLFWVKLSDISAALGIGDHRDMYGTVEQLISLMGLNASYDRSFLQDQTDPRLIVRINDP